MSRSRRLQVVGSGRPGGRKREVFRKRRRLGRPRRILEALLLIAAGVGLLVLLLQLPRLIDLDSLLLVSTAIGHLIRGLADLLHGLLQLLAVLAVNGWGEESFRQLLSTTVVTQSPMAFVGLSLMLIAARLDDPRSSRTPLHWFVCVISGVLALSLLVTIPVSIAGDRTVSEQADQTLMAQKGQLEMARAQLQNPQVVEQVIAQGERAGQDRKSTRLNSSHIPLSRMPSSA